MKEYLALIDHPEDIDNAFVAVDIMSFRNATRDISFDVYLKIADNHIAHVFSRSTGLDYKRLAQYISKGVARLHIKKADQAAYEAFVARSADSIFNDPSTPQEKKIATLLNMTEQNMAELFTRFEVSGETAESTEKVVKNYVTLMTESPKTLAVLLKLVAHGEYLYYHSIAVSIFSMFIAKATGQLNQRTIEIVGMGGFLHDIGSTNLPKDVVDSHDDLSDDEWDQMKSHPKLGLQMLESAPNVPDEVRYIVYQHHEYPDAKGYPNGLANTAIYYPAKIVGVADAFCALISKRPFRPAYSPEEAIQILRKEPGKYDTDIVRVLASIFVPQTQGAIGTKKAA